MTNQTETTKIKFQKIIAGYYKYTDNNGTTWILEHVTKDMGFTYDEWHLGPENDPHCDQYETKHEAVESLTRVQNAQ